MVVAQFKTRPTAPRVFACLTDPQPNVARNIYVNKHPGDKLAGKAWSFPALSLYPSLNSFIHSFPPSPTPEPSGYPIYSLFLPVGRSYRPQFTHHFAEGFREPVVSGGDFNWTPL